MRASLRELTLWRFGRSLIGSSDGLPLSILSWPRLQNSTNLCLPLHIFDACAPATSISRPRASFGRQMGAPREVPRTAIVGY
jgi:hypothetical protein